MSALQVLDAPTRAALPNTTRWYLTCRNFPAFISALGSLILYGEVRLFRVAVLLLVHYFRTFSRVLHF